MDFIILLTDIVKTIVSFFLKSMSKYDLLKVSPKVEIYSKKLVIAALLITIIVLYFVDGL